MLFFLVCADEARGRAECLGRGWVQVGVARFFTPARDDVRVVRRFADVVLLPGGTWMMAGEDYLRNPERDAFDNLVSAGVAKWVTGEEPKAAAAAEAEEEAPGVRWAEIPPAPPSGGRDAWPPRTAPPLLTGGHRGPRPSRR